MTHYPRFDWTGVIFGLVFAGMGFAASCWVWPDGALDKPIASLTLGELLRVAGSIFFDLVGLLGIAWAIKDANEPFR
jgi:dipeptide/tripeptide permease